MFSENSSILISPEKNLIDEVLSLLVGDDSDYSSNLVVFPGKRPAHFLRKALGNKEKKSFIPPRIFSMDSFIDYTYEEELKLFHRKLDHIDAVSVLYDIHKESPNPVGNRGFLTPDSFFPIGLKIWRDIEEMLVEGVKKNSIINIEQLTNEAIPEGALKNLQSLSFFYEQFYLKIKEIGCSSRALRYHTVSEEVGTLDLSRYNKIIFAGFFIFTKTEQVMVKSIAKDENTFFLSHKPEVAQVTSKPKIRFYKSPDTHGQVFGINRILNSHKEENKELDEKTVIVLPSSDALFPLLHQSLPIVEENECGYNISMGYPLHRTPVFGFLNNMMQLISSMDDDRFYASDYLKFVLHPYTKNIYFAGKTDITRIMFHTIEEELLKNRNKAFFKFSDIEDDREMLKKVTEKVAQSQGTVTLENIKEHICAIHAHTIKLFLGFKNVGDFALKAIEILTYIYQNSTARLHPLFYPFSESLITALHRVSVSLIKDVEFTESSAYFSLIKKYIMTCHAPFEGAPLKGLQVLGFLETRNLKFDTVFFADLNEDVIPNIKSEDSLLPVKARELLGLPTYRDREKLVSHYFETLINSAKNVHLFFIENDRKEKSRFVEKLLWEQQKQEKKIDITDCVKSIHYSVNLGNKSPLSIEKSDEMVQFLKTYKYSASSLDAYLKCPLKFYYRYVLNKRKKEVFSGEIEKSEIGIFVHTVLNRYFAKKTGFSLTEEDCGLLEMENIVDALFIHSYGKDSAGAAYLINKQIKKHLVDYLKYYQLPVVREGNLTIFGLEKKIDIVKDGFNLSGRLDRVERRSGKIFVIDYKTSSNSKYLKIDFSKLEGRQTWGEAIGTLQMAFYLLLFLENSKKNIKDVSGIFLLLGRAGLSRKIEVPLFTNDEDFIDHYERISEVILCLLGEIVDPGILFCPTDKTKDLCPGCEYQYICGVG